MDRITGTDLGNNEKLALVYANANLENANTLFINTLQNTFRSFASGRAIDLGCGPGDITLCFARRFPQSTVLGIDGSDEMIRIARERLETQIDVVGGISYMTKLISGKVLSEKRFDLIFSNSVLHNLPNPNIFWRTVAANSQSGTRIFIMDLVRPKTVQAANDLVETYTADEPEILKTNFSNSLCAAFRPDEVRQQLMANGLSQLHISTISDRHMRISGKI